MQRNFRHFLLKIELLKSRIIFFICAAAFVGIIVYVLFFVISIKSPQVYDSHIINQFGGETQCNENLDVTTPGEMVNQENKKNQCLNCQELSNSESQKISFKATYTNLIIHITQLFRTTTPEEELTKGLKENKKELAQMRVAKVSEGTASKLGRIKIDRKSIAKDLTIMTEQNRKVKEIQKGKQKPLDMRHEKTISIHKIIPKKQQDSKVLRVVKRERNFPLRKVNLRE